MVLIEFYKCSVCGRKLPTSTFGDAQKHLLKHIGINAKLLFEDEFLAYKDGVNHLESRKWDGV